MRDSKGVKGNTMQIRERREALKLSMRAAAKLGGLSPQGWSAVEAGTSPPSLATQRAVAAALGWPVDWLEQIERDGAVTLPAGESAGLADRVTALEGQVREIVTLMRRIVLDEVAVDPGAGQRSRKARPKRNA